MEPIKVGLVDVGIRYGLSEIIAEAVELYNAGSINHIFLFGKNYSQINAISSVSFCGFLRITEKKDGRLT